MISPWENDAVSLLDAFRNGDRSPLEEVEAVLKHIKDSALNAFSHIDEELSLQRAKSADLTLPLGGIPIAVKEPEQRVECSKQW